MRSLQCGRDDSIVASRDDSVVASWGDSFVVSLDDSVVGSRDDSVVAIWDDCFLDDCDDMQAICLVRRQLRSHAVYKVLLSPRHNPHCHPERSRRTS